MLRRWYFFVAALVAFIAWRNGRVVNIAFRKRPLPSAYFATPFGNASTSCQTIIHPNPNPNHPSLKYCEDAALWDYFVEGEGEKRLALVSCDSNRKNWNTVMGPLKDPYSPGGAIYSFHFDANGLRGEPQYVELEGYPENRPFHPLGIEAWPSKDGSPSYMFVVNHGAERSTIEQFQITAPHLQGAPRLRWVRSISSRYLIAPNSVALTSPTSFFVSNDHLMTRRLPGILGEILPMVETLLALPLGFIGHVAIINDAIQGAAIVRHTLPQLFIPFPNGIALRQDGRALAVASSSLAAVFIYHRTLPLSPESGHPGKLTLAETIHVPFPPDNVRYDDSDTLLIAGHPYFPDLTSISKNTSLTGTSPSWVVELVPHSDENMGLYGTTRHGKYDLRTIYQSDGLRAEGSGSFSSSTTGVRDSRTGVVIIPGLYAEEGVLICVPKRNL